MVNGSENSLTANNILSRISEYDIYRYYIGHDFTLKKLFPSPFRPEKVGSFNIFATGNGLLRHKDFGDSYYSGNCFKFVQQMYGLDFNNALIKISKDFGLGIGVTKDTTVDYGSAIKEYIQSENSSILEESEVEEIRDTRVRIHVQAKPFSTEELKYWGRYGITLQDLNANNIYSVDKLYINGRLIRNWTKEFRFAYHYIDGGEEFFKIYSPYSNGYKWISNVPVRKPLNFQKLPQNSPTIIIAKSKKDKMIIEKIHSDVYEVQKEGKEVIAPELDSFFDEFYDQKLCFFDSDETGKRASTELNDLNYGWINIPNEYYALGIKDPGELIEYFGVEDGMKLLEIIIKRKLIESRINKG